MANTISTGGSGLDIATLVSQLVAATRSPTETRINNAGAAATSKLSAIGQIKSTMSTLQSALEKMSSGSDTPSYKATVGTGASFTASTGAGAVAGEYSVEVVRLATAQKLSSAGHATGTTFGAGTLDIRHGSGDADVVSVEVKAGASLADIASAVNTASGGKGVTASVITADDGQHLVFTAASTGSAGALTIEASGDGSLAALTNGVGGGLTQTVGATDALVRVDGFERTSSSNTLTDLVPGVTLTLTKADPGNPHLLGVSDDNSNLKSAISAYVTAYNSVMSTLKSTSNFNATSKTASALTGDSLVRTLQQQLRNQVSGNVTELKELGVTVDKSGVMSFDAAAFDKAIAVNPSAAGALLGKNGTYGGAMVETLKMHLDSIDGSLAKRTEGLNDQIKRYEDEMDRLDVRMSKLSERYLAQFTAMETAIQTLQANASSLNSLLSSSD